MVDLAEATTGRGLPGLRLRGRRARLDSGRVRAGRRPLTPDIGHRRRRTVLLGYTWAGVLAFGAVALALIDDRSGVFAR